MNLKEGPGDGGKRLRNREGKTSKEMPENTVEFS
jgi:hypothetical protein